MLYRILMIVLEANSVVARLTIEGRRKFRMVFTIII